MTHATKEYEDIMRVVQVGRTKKTRGLTFYKQRKWISQDQELGIMISSKNHDKAIAGHVGVEKSLKNIQQVYFWSNYGMMLRLTLKIVLLINNTMQVIKNELVYYNLSLFSNNNGNVSP